MENYRKVKMSQQDQRKGRKMKEIIFAGGIREDVIEEEAFVHLFHGIALIFQPM